ncbi:recombinase family protein [Chloroflexota bacterium]
MKAAIYCRVSTDNQEQEGTSLDSQQEACLKKAEELGYEVSEENIISETYSGLSIERPLLTVLRERVRQKEVDAVIGYTLDRVSRDPVHFIILQDEFEKAGIKLILVTEDLDSTDMGKLITHIKGFSAKIEALKIRERTMRGRKARKDAGKLANGKANHLFGYTYRPGREEGEGVRYINDSQAKIVVGIFQWYVEEGMPLDRVVYRLKALGINSPSGNPMWSRATAYQMLTNSAYCGLQGPATPAIITEDIYNKVQKRLKRNRELASRNVKRNYLLRGYIRCEYCGRAYQGALKTYRTKSGVKEYLYYRCSSSFKINANPCPNPSHKAEYIEGVIWQEIESALLNPKVVLAGLEALKEESGKTNTHLEELSSIESRLSEIESQQAQLLQWALKGFPEETVNAENIKLNNNRRLLEERKTIIESNINTATKAGYDIEGVKEAVELVKANLKDLSFESKGKCLKLWI